MGYFEFRLTMLENSLEWELLMLASILKNIRIEKGMTQLQLAEALERPQSFVFKYESGERRLDVNEFISVCRALKEDPPKIIKIVEMSINRGF